VRRFKKDIEDQVQDQFSERAMFICQVAANPAEEVFFDELAAARFHTLAASW
jgi:hypothetical protein